MTPMTAERPTPAPPAVAATPATVAMCGDVVCESVAGRSTLTRVWATDPLKLLTPATPGPARQVVLSSYGGGLLGGDRVAVRATVKTSARLVLTTQSTNKVYRTDGSISSQSLDATVGDDAWLAVLPDALCPFADSRFRQRQRFDLSAIGNLVWLDWLTSGRHGRGERWAMDTIDSRTEIAVSGRTVARETLSLDAAAHGIGSAMRVGRFDCYAVLGVVGPATAAIVDHARSVVRSIELSKAMPLLAADAALVGGALFRILGPDVQTVGALLRRMLAPLDDRLGHSPWGRKW